MTAPKFVCIISEVCLVSQLTYFLMAARRLLLSALHLFEFHAKASPNIYTYILLLLAFVILMPCVICFFPNTQRHKSSQFILYSGILSIISLLCCTFQSGFLSRIESSRLLETVSAVIFSRNTSSTIRIFLIYIFLGLFGAFMPQLCKSEAPPVLSRSVLNEMALNFSGQLPPFYFA